MSNTQVWGILTKYIDHFFFLCQFSPVYSYCLPWNLKLCQFVSLIAPLSRIAPVSLRIYCERSNNKFESRLILFLNLYLSSVYSRFVVDSFRLSLHYNIGFGQNMSVNTKKKRNHSRCIIIVFSIWDWGGGRGGNILFVVVVLRDDTTLDRLIFVYIVCTGVCTLIFIASPVSVFVGVYWVMMISIIFIVKLLANRSMFSVQFIDVLKWMSKGCAALRSVYVRVTL